MKSLSEIADIIDKINIDDLSNKMEYLKTIRFNSDNTTKSLSGNDKSGSRTKYGIYSHSTLDGEVLYIGKAERSTIAARQDSHLNTFRYPHKIQERTGMKYRELIKNRGLNYLDIVIKYLDMSDLPKYLIPMVEIIFIDRYQPAINQETENAKS